MIAIVIPYFKINFFEKTLESLLQQTNKNFCVYIGDDNSPNDPQDIIIKYSKQLNIVYHRFEDNMGGISLPKQWERCMALSQTEEWFILLGDDDFLQENYIEEFYNNLTKINDNGCKVVRFSTFLVDENGTINSKKFENPTIEKSTDYYFKKTQQLTRGSMSEFIYKKEQYQKYKFVDYPLAWSSDNMAVLQYSEFKNIYSINTASAFVRISPFNISGTGSFKSLEKDLSVFLFYRDIIFKYFFHFKIKHIYYYTKYMLVYGFRYFFKIKS